MGFFSLKQTCAICGGDASLNRFQIENKQWLCSSCYKKCNFGANNPFRFNMPVSQINAILGKNAQSVEELSAFVVSKQIGSYLQIDNTNKKWLIPDGTFGKVKRPTIHDFSDIVDYELIEDGSSISSGGLGRALAGGVLLGNVGAIVGSTTGKKKSRSICDVLKIKITLNDIACPTAYINFISTSTKKDGFVYKTCFSAAQECMSLFQLMCNESQPDQSSQAAVAPSSTADELLKFKQLLDMGAITQEEYDEKKKNLLSI